MEEPTPRPSTLMAQTTHPRSHGPERGPQLEQRRGHTHTRGFSASFLSGVLRLILGLWPDLTPQNHSFRSAPDNRKLGAFGPWLPKFSGQGPTGEVKHPVHQAPSPRRSLGMGLRHPSPPLRK